MEISGLLVEILIVCILVSGFFSGSETALTSLSEAKTRQIIESKRSGSKALQLWLNWPNRVLTTLLVGNTIANASAASIATVLGEEIFGNLGAAIGTGIVTILLLLLAEVAPKTFARHNAERVAPILMTVLFPLYWIFSPLVTIISFLASLIVRLSGGKSSSMGPIATEEDIEFMVRLGQQEGIIPKDQGKMLESVFEFADTLVKEAMLPRTDINSIEQDATLEEIIAEVKEHGHTRWPVYEDNLDHVVGIFHAKDLLNALLDNRETFSLAKYLRPALFVPDVMKIGALLKEFRHGRAHLAIVVDEYGGTAGMITLEDIIEEIVGEIRDEYDSEEDERVLHKIDENNYSADGKAGIYHLKEHLGIEFPEDESFESLAGFLIATYGKMPPANAEIDFEGWRFMIKNVDQKRISTVLIRKIAEPDLDPKKIKSSE